MFTMRDVLVEEERRRDEMQRVEYGRLARKITPPNKLKCFLCVHLGKTLVQAGSRLQARYAPQSSALTSPRIVNPEIRMQSR